MKTKLTLRLDEELIETAKQVAVERGISISRIVANYFAGLRQTDRPENEHLAPLTASLFGVIEDAQLSREDHRKHLEHKHE